MVFDNSSKAYAISGTSTIQGFGSLTKSGTEKVSIPTTNTYSSDTTINAGSLGSGTIVNNASLVIDWSDTLTLPAALTGSGNLTQFGTGTSIFAADNSYTGTTTITNGTLQVGNGGVTGSLGSTTPIVNNGTFAFQRSGSQTYTFDISGTSDYSGGAEVVDFITSGSTLDAKLSTLTLGKHDTGAGNFNNATSGTFTFNLGTLDATNIIMAEAGLPNNKTANGTLTSNGGTIKVENLKLVQDISGVLGTATVNLNQGATLEATNINGQAAANALINLNQGSIKNTVDIDLQISATTLVLPYTPAARSLINSNASPILFANTCVIDPRLNTTGATPSVGNFTLTGALDITDVTLNITNNPGTPIILPTGTKLTLIDYTAGTNTGTFNGIADESSITIGANTFVIDYNDTLGATGSFVTLTAANGSPYAVWAANFELNPNVATAAADGDFDKDGVANMTEYVLGASPSNGTQT